MRSNLRLGHASLDGIREIGGFGQPLHALYPQIRAVLSFEFGPDAADLLAEPVVDRSKNRIDWYAEGEPDEKPTPLADLPEEEQQAIVAGVEEFLNRGRQLAERYSTSEDTQRAQIGAILKAVFAKSTETEVFIINGKPVMTGWGFSTDAPWNLSPNAEQQIIQAGEHGTKSEATTVSDSVTPEEPVIENKSPASLQTSSTEIGQESEPPPVISTLDRGQAQVVDEASAVAGDSSPLVTQSQPVRQQERGHSEDKQVLASGPAVASAALLHYVVVGSRYFWGVVVLSLLALLLAAAWGFMKERITPTETPAIPTAMTHPKFDERLSQLQQEETQLRGQLEKLLVRLASQRGQCQLQSDVSSPLPKLPAPDQAQTEMIPSGVASGVSKPSSDPVPANTTILAQTEAGARVLPVPSAHNSESVVSIQPNTDAQAPQAPPLAPDAIRTANETTSVKPLTSLSSSSPTPSAVLKPLSIPQTTPDVSMPKDSALPGSQWRETSPGQTLEETLTGRESSASAPVQEQAPVKPPVKAEPTAEERREFANRMSATGATSGEITATLLWNGHGDLDLVVRCPAGHQLDFRNTNKCGGTLDVDANASRDRLQERPVENAFWPAGTADPGVYEVGVRYVPRKDEDTPLETPFQVRLSRGGQEAVFKGTIRPNAVVPVTTFTVKR